MRYKMPEGFKVEFQHRQFAKPLKINLNGHGITPRGYTFCILKSEQGVILAEGIAWCRDTDQFNRSIGRAISMGRALKDWHNEVPIGAKRNAFNR